MEGAALSTPQNRRLSDRAASFESPSKSQGARLLEEGCIPDSHYENVLRAIALYAEKILLRDLASMPPPLGVDRMIPFEVLATDPFVLSMTLGDASIVLHALQVSPNITIDTDHHSGTTWIGDKQRYDWPTQSTIALQVPVSLGTDANPIGDKLQPLTGQPIERLWPVKSVQFPGAGSGDATGSATGAPTIINSDGVECSEWLVGFSCGAAALHAFRDFTDKRIVHDGRTHALRPQWKRTSGKMQRRIDRCYPVSRVRHAASRGIDVAGPILRRCPEYVPPKPVKEAKAPATRARSAGPASNQRGSNSAGAKTRSQSLPRMHRQPPGGPSQAQIEEAAQLRAGGINVQLRPSRTMTRVKSDESPTETDASAALQERITGPQRRGRSAGSRPLDHHQATRVRRTRSQRSEGTGGPPRSPSRPPKDSAARRRPRPSSLASSPLRLIGLNLQSSGPQRNNVASCRPPRMLLASRAMGTRLFTRRGAGYAAAVAARPPATMKTKRKTAKNLVMPLVSQLGPRRPPSQPRRNLMMGRFLS
jgi:hypothetical protein